uniref:cGMP-dependent protein kinase n=1 Tax=Glossina brevipalpis TaxID=37001 RepID=A0A1A9W6T0_9MUSC
MAMKSPTKKSPTEGIIKKRSSLLERCHESEKDVQQLTKDEETQVPKLNTTSQNSFEETSLLEKATATKPSKLVISRSQDDDYVENATGEQYDRVSPIYYYSSTRGCLSYTGATRANKFRSRFHKSHTCGSLFAKCNCDMSNDTPLPTAMEYPERKNSSRAPSIESDANSTLYILNTTATTTTKATVHKQPQYAFHLSISPSSNTELSLASATSASDKCSSSGFHSFSSQTSSATSAYLSRDESFNTSFDGSKNDNNNLSKNSQLLSPTDKSVTDSVKTTTATAVKTADCGSHNTQIIKSTVSTEQEALSLTQRSYKQTVPRISSPCLGESKFVISPKQRKSEICHKQLNKKLFQSYSHPDTSFVFTDENKHPPRESLVQQQNVDQIITTRGGKVEIKQPKRSSSPNIGQILDVAVHPDILVKISPKHSPLSDHKRQHSPLILRSTQQRRRLLQRSHEIDSGGSTSESEKSVDIKTPTEEQKVAALKDNTDFHAAHKYFAESGILGPLNNTSKNLLKKTSKILQESNVIEQLRKTSMILRTNSPNNTNRSVSVSQRSESIPEDPYTSAPSTATSNTYPTTIISTSSITNPVSGPYSLGASKNFTLKLQTDANVTTATETVASSSVSPLESAATETSPQSPHTMATTCGFSPNLTTQSCIPIDDKDTQIKSLLGEIVSLKDVIKSRDSEIVKLRREIHKLKSVLQQTTNHLTIANDELLQPSSPPTHIPNKFFMPQPLETNNIFAKLCENCKKFIEHSSIDMNPSLDNFSTQLMSIDNGERTSVDITLKHRNLTASNIFNSTENELEKNFYSNDLINCQMKTNLSCIQPQIQQPLLLKKQGVSGESLETSMQQNMNNTPIPKYEKDYSSKQLIKDAIMDNDFLKNIDSSQVKELVDSMYSLIITKGQFVIREGDVGAHLYVSAEGEFEVEKNGKILGIMGPGKAFGELAILYNCTRTASIRVLSNARVWVLDRRVFQQIMMRTGMQRIENSVNFLKSVPLLKNLSEELLSKIADVLEVEFYPSGTYIIRQGASGDTFFLISQGMVKVTQKLSGSVEEKEIRILKSGDYFGEQALINEDKRTANIIALDPGVECLTLDRDSFKHLIGDLSELKQKNYGDENRILAIRYAERTKEMCGANAKQEFPDLNLSDLEVVTTLGVGGFGRVELVKACRQNRTDIFALKCLKKRHIVDTKQEEHVFSERTIMMSCNCPFICRLYRTFRDEKYVYMLLEACMGGEIWTLLRDRGSFNENATQFIIGCVLQAFEYLHARGIVYRDLKPENLMLNENGYVKLVDFGFAKFIGNSNKTWTFCGTPEYVAPEIILNKGHDLAVDYWALGILIHELLNGTPPFTCNDPMQTYNIILKGIDMIDFPKHMSRAAVQLIKKLCRDSPVERLGYQKGGIQDIKKHKWFLGFDWDGLRNQLLIPPFIRPITGPTDTSYFDKFSIDVCEPPDELSGWDADF